MLYKISVFVLKILFKIFYKVEVKNRLTFNENQSYLVCPNHIHLFDPILIACNINRDMHFMGKQELFAHKFSNWFFRQLGGFPVDRNGSDVVAIKTAINILKNNEVLCVFPEGTRSKTGQLGEFKSGVGLIALRGNTPIIPVKIEGSYKLFTKIKLTFGNPIVYTGKNRDELTNMIKTSIMSM